MNEIIDQFLWTKDNKVITRDKHLVPGLANFSHWNYRTAATPAPVHYHTGIFEIHCMVRGRRNFQIQDPSGQLRSISVSGGQAAITFPGQVHGYQDTFVEPYEFYSLQLDIGNPPHMLGLNQEYSQNLCQDMLSLQQKLQSLNEQRLELGSTHINLLRSAFNFFSTFQEDDTRMGVQFLSTFLFSLKYLNPVTGTHKIDEHIQTAIDYIRANYAEKPSLQHLAEKAGYSLSYFKAKFKEETGMTPADYLSSLRLEYAKDRLTNSTSSITRISTDLNFSSPSHFCSSFKKRTSYTPKEYRERSGRDG